jgi:uncharacterized protein (DUF849 family)
LLSSASPYPEREGHLTASELAPQALATSASIEQVLTRAEITARRGCQARIGLEDTLLVPQGELASHNAALVAAARRLLADTSRALGTKRDP